VGDIARVYVGNVGHGFISVKSRVQFARYVGDVPHAHVRYYPTYIDDVALIIVNLRMEFARDVGDVPHSYVRHYLTHIN